MYITWGSRLYGKVDEVKGLFYVKTKFGHCQFIPFIPIKSFIILTESGGKFQGVPIGLNTKSWMVTWGRTALFGALIPVSIFCMAMWGEVGNGGSVMLAILATVGMALVVGGLLVLFLHKRVRYASYPRAVQLAEKVGLNPVGHVMIEMAFGKMSQEEGRQLIAQLKAAPPPAPSDSSPDSADSPIDLAALDS
jgi:hypothetical protein